MDKEEISESEESPQIPQEEESSPLIKILLKKVLERNARETTPFEGVFGSHAKLREKHQALQSFESGIRIELKSLHYDALSAVSSAGAGENSADKNDISEKAKAVVQLSDRIAAIQKDLKTRYQKESKEDQTRIDMLSKIAENEKLVKDQAEELALFKSKLAEANISISQHMESQEESEKNLSAVQKELSFTREIRDTAEQKFRKIENENDRLVTQLLDLKNNNAEELNSMNEMVDSLKSQSLLNKASLFFNSLGAAAPALPTGSDVAAAGGDNSNSHSNATGAAGVENKNKNSFQSEKFVRVTSSLPNNQKFSFIGHSGEVNDISAVDVYR